MTPAEESRARDAARDAQKAMERVRRGFTAALKSGALKAGDEGVEAMREAIRDAGTHCRTLCMHLVPDPAEPEETDLDERREEVRNARQW